MTKPPAMDQPLFTFREIIATLAAVLVAYDMPSIEVSLKEMAPKLDDIDIDWVYAVKDGKISVTRTKALAETTHWEGCSKVHRMCKGAVDA